ncbi:exodeoxyribonuclease vii large subunit [Neofusicoccum parvum]|nr:exodeoxyribonuclease vii large subunit [Neofusicoccum parvum]
MTLKAGGHSDKAVAAALVARGLHAYDPKSISTRHRRIREARAAETDRALRLRRRRWTAAEDEALVGAYLGALRRQDDEVRRLRRRFYRDVAAAVGERVAGSFFSAAACEERYRELVAEEAMVEGEWGDVEVERREGVKRLTAFWEQECERARREDGAWQDHLVKEAAEVERERRKEERARRGGTEREVAFWEVP